MHGAQPFPQQDLGQDGRRGAQAPARTEAAGVGKGNAAGSSWTMGREQLSQTTQLEPRTPARPFLLLWTGAGRSGGGLRQGAHSRGGSSWVQSAVGASGGEVACLQSTRPVGRREAGRPPGCPRARLCLTRAPTHILSSAWAWARRCTEHSVGPGCPAQPLSKASRPPRGPRPLEDRAAGLASTRPRPGAWLPFPILGPGPALCSRLSLLE